MGDSGKLIMHFNMTYKTYEYITACATHGTQVTIDHVCDAHDTGGAPLAGARVATLSSILEREQAPKMHPCKP